jgi:HicA toxin of bacterial toxin-antitoxin,
MGRLSGFRYRDIIKILKKFGFDFHRQAAGSHEIWHNPTTKKKLKSESVSVFRILVLQRKIRNPPRFLKP